jgi:antirestriction protein ArdC
MNFRQALELGGNVRKREKGSPASPPIKATDRPCG